MAENEANSGVVCRNWDIFFTCTQSDQRYTHKLFRPLVSSLACIFIALEEESLTYVFLGLISKDCSLCS